MASFVDEAQVNVKGGDGGAGAVSFRREAHVSRGGPDGGDGGNGGNVVLEASSNLASLLAFRDYPHRRADNGAHGSGARRHGRNGSDLVVLVPEGTIVRSADGAVLADLTVTGDRLLAAEGGRGGRGNARFLSNRLRAPAFAEQGEVGEERWLDLELKLLADVALVGFPNAGKSSLISRISAAKPKIADYPFTTLEPHLGVVRAPSREIQEFVVADIPGLVEGASEGRGLGHQFLRHVERARVLVVLVDLAEDAGRAPELQLAVLIEELGRHRADLLERPRLVVGSRADTVSERPDPARYGGALEISSATGEGLGELVRRLASLVSSARADRPSARREPVLHRPTPQGVSVRKENETFVVEGREAVRAVAFSDLNNADAQALAWKRLRHLGVAKSLQRAGARPGDLVRIGAMTFEYEPGD